MRGILFGNAFFRNAVSYLELNRLARSAASAGLDKPRTYLKRNRLFGLVYDSFFKKVASGISFGGAVSFSYAGMDCRCNAGNIWTLALYNLK